MSKASKILEHFDRIERLHESSDIKIFLTNLGKYNEGELVGEWVTLPCDDFKPIMERIGIDGVNYEETFITDYEAPFEIGEYENLDTLNEKAEVYSRLDEQDEKIINCLTDALGYDFEEALEKVEDHDYTFFEGDTEEDLAYNYIDQMGGIENAVTDRQYYFDYEGFGRDLTFNGDYYPVENAVDVNDFSDKDTAILIFTEEGIESDENIENAKHILDLYNQYEELEEGSEESEKFAEENGIEINGDYITYDGNDYDTETLNQIVDGNYATKTGYMDNGGYIVEVSDDKALGEYVVDEQFGGIDKISQDEFERYFDYKAYGRDLEINGNFTKIDGGYVTVD